MLCIKAAWWDRTLISSETIVFLCYVVIVLRWIQKPFTLNRIRKKSRIILTLQNNSIVNVIASSDVTRITYFRGEGRVMHGIKQGFSTILPSRAIFLTINVGLKEELREGRTVVFQVNQNIYEI